MSVCVVGWGLLGVAVDFSESFLQNLVAIPVRGATDSPARRIPWILEVGGTRSLDFLLKYKVKQLKSLSRKRCDQVYNMKLRVVGRSSKDRWAVPGPGI